jgi:hemolysin activation/secretion protein
MKLTRIFISGSIVSSLVFSQGNFAQTPQLDASLPGAAQSQQVGQALQEQSSPSLQARPRAMTKPEAVEPKIPEKLKKIKFKLNGIKLVGNTVYSTAELSQFYKHLLGKTISVADLFVMIQNITNYYRNNGYILTRAILPEQKVTSGIVRIEVIEGYIGNTSIAGSSYGAAIQVMKFGNKIKETRPLQISIMEKYLYQMNEIPGTAVKSRLLASHGKIPAVGSSDVEFLTENRPVTGYFSYDNYGTLYVGPQQMTGNIAFNSFLKSGDAGAFTYVRTPKGQELNYFDVNYNLPTDSAGSRFLMGATRTVTNPLFVLTPLKISGLTNNYYFLFTYPMIRTRDKNLSLRVGLDYLDSPTTFLDDSLPLYTDHLRNLDLGLSYNFADKWLGVNLVMADIRQGLPIFGYSSNFNPNTAETSRPGGRGKYTKVLLNLTRLQAIKGPFSLYGAAKGQWGFNPLLSSEQFTFGGSIIGRGYDSAEILGDKGVSGSLELRYDRPVGYFGVNDLQFYIFYDGGIVWNYLFVGNVPIKQSATSTGIGMRFYMTKFISGNFMWTKPLTKQVASKEVVGEGWRPRVFFSVITTFG